MLPLEIVDHIFSFLSTDVDSLEGCSIADPVLAPIAGRHLYRHISITNLTSPRRRQVLEYGHVQVKTLLSEKPLIANYVRILEIHVFPLTHNLQHSIDEIIPLLPVFLRPECIVLSWAPRWACMSTDFIAALERCMRLPSLTEVRFEVIYPIPFNLLDNWNIKSLTFGPVDHVIASLHSEPVPDPPNFQLESLSVVHIAHPSFHFVSWAKNHVHNLRSLFLRDLVHKDLLETCSTTLTSLHLDFHASCFTTTYNHGAVSTPPSPNAPVNLSSLPHLQELTLRAHIRLSEVPDSIYRSSLPTVIELVKTSPPLQRLVLEFFFWGVTPSTFPRTDLSSITVFANSFRRIEIRMRTCRTMSCVPAATVLSCLVEGDEGLMTLYRQGVLVIPELRASENHSDRWLGSCSLWVH